MKANMEKITNIINKEIGANAEMMVLTYLLDKGFTFCQNITDEDIDELDGNGLMTKEFVQCLVRCARELAKNVSITDIMQYIRCEAWMTPVVKEMSIWKEDVADSTWDYFVNELDINPDEASKEEEIVFKVIREEN